MGSIQQAVTNRFAWQKNHRLAAGRIGQGIQCMKRTSRTFREPDRENW